MDSNVTPKNILLVEDATPMARVYCEYLRNEPYGVQVVETGKEALLVLRQSPPDAILLDLQLPDMTGLDILKIMRDEKIDLPVIVITANGSVNRAVEAMQLGAADFIAKPFNADRLIYTLRNSLERSELKQTVATIKQDLDCQGYFGFIGSSLPMQAIYRTIDSAACSKTTIFISGESGTGKEVCADAIHRRSDRSGGPFIALNCAAIPKDLIESEIFGHTKGAFTGAVTDRDGAATLADGGTLFLDEICEMDVSLQGKLLRFVQTSRFTKVGAGKEQVVDVRIVCATNRDPWAEVEAGRFREDLYFRLHVIPILLPPLRERQEDTRELAEHFLARFAAEESKSLSSFSAEAENHLMQQAWPGNVRELENVVRTAVVLNDGDELTLEMLPAGRASFIEPTVAALSPVASVGRMEANSIRPMWMIERDAIEAALIHSDNNVTVAAAGLEMSASTVYRRIKEYRARTSATAA